MVSVRSCVFYRVRTSSAAMVTVWLVTITGRMFAYRMSAVAEREGIWIDLAVGYRREQEDGRWQRTEEPLRRGQKIVPNAVRSDMSSGYFVVVQTTFTSRS